MKILYINSLYNPYFGGGAEKTLQALAEKIRHKGHEVTVLTTGFYSAEEEINGIRVIRKRIANVYWHYQKERPSSPKRFLWHLFDIYNPVMKKAVYEAIEDTQPDVVSIHNLAGFSAAAWSAVKQSGVPIAQVLHDLYNLCPNSNMFNKGKTCHRQCLRCKLFRLFHPRLSTNVDAVVGVSRFVLSRHLQHGLFRNAPIKKVIYNARALKPVNKGSRDKGTGSVRFGFMGTLTPAKGIEVLLQCFNSVAGTNAKLLIAGKGKEQYEKRLKTKFSSSRVYFLGYRAPEEFFQEIDVLIVPSIWEEALGMVIPEAWAFNVPVIGAKRGGIPEMIEQDKNGFLFDPARPDELTEIIRHIIADPASLSSLASNAASSARYFLDMARWINQWISLYNELIQLNRQHRI